MAPTLTGQYSKDLSEWPHTGDTRFVRCGYLLASRSLFKISEHEIIEPEDDIRRYIVIERVGASISDTKLSTKIFDLQDDGLSEQAIIETILRSGVIDHSKNQVTGRVGLRNYSFMDNAVKIKCYQVAGAYIHPDSHRKGIMSRTYLFMLNWYGHLVCDDMQTIPGAKIWAGPLVRAGEVRIYNEKGDVFEDVLGEKGIGKHAGFVPWNKGQIYNVSGWHPNHLQTTVQKFIVLVISRDTSKEIGYMP